MGGGEGWDVGAFCAAGCFLGNGILVGTGTAFGGHLKEAKGHSQPNPLELWRNAGGWFISHACMRLDWFRFSVGDGSS